MNPLEASRCLTNRNRKGAGSDSRFLARDENPACTTRLVQCDSLIGFLSEGGSSFLWWLIADCGRICLQIVRLPAVLPYSTFRNPADGRLPKKAKTSGFSLFLWQLSCGDSSFNLAEFVSKLSVVTGCPALLFSSRFFWLCRPVSSNVRFSSRFSPLVSGFRAFYLVHLVPLPNCNGGDSGAVINVTIQNTIYQSELFGASDT